MVQEPLFHEDWRDALKHVVKALGGFEAVGADLWPSWTRKKAGNWLSDCLNPERPAKLDLEDVEALLRMGRAKGVHVGLHFLCDSTGYDRPGIAPTKTPAQELAEKMQRTLAEFQRLAAEQAALMQTVAA